MIQFTLFLCRDVVSGLDTSVDQFRITKIVSVFIFAVKRVRFIKLKQLIFQLREIFRLNHWLNGTR